MIAAALRLNVTMMKRSGVTQIRNYFLGRAFILPLSGKAIGPIGRSFFFLFLHKRRRWFGFSPQIYHDLCYTPNSSQFLYLGIGANVKLSPKLHELKDWKFMKGICGSYPQRLKTSTSVRLRGGIFGGCTAMK
jgi:uncharacterized protein YlbG (UPF0298 family)